MWCLAAVGKRPEAVCLRRSCEGRLSHGWVGTPGRASELLSGAEALCRPLHGLSMAYPWPHSARLGERSLAVMSTIEEVAAKAAAKRVYALYRPLVRCPVGRCGYCDRVFGGRQ